MKIGRLDGSITFASGAIERRVDRAQFLDTAIGRAAKETLVNGDWRHYHIEPEDGIAGTVLFEGNRIDRIFLTMAMPDDDAQHWSVKHELERGARHERWLRDELGAPPYEYHWGKVFSEFDPKGVASEIIVVYEW